MRLALIFLASIVRAEEKPDEAAAIAKINSLGGEIERKSQQGNPEGAGKGSSPERPAGKKASANDPVVLVSLIGSMSLKDDDLSCLRSFPELTHLFLGRTAVSDAGVQHVAALKHLKQLGLIGTKITDASLKELAGLPQLRHLFLSDTPISDAGLADICKLKGLETLLLGHTGVTGSGLRNAEELPKLKYLDLSGTRFADAATAELAKFPNLQELSLESTPISDAGLKALGNLRNLTALDLSGTRITDSGLEQLAALKNLKTLRVAETKVTKAGSARLKELRPQIRIAQQNLGQRADPDFDVSVAKPAFTAKHPTVLFDEAHRNFHTASGRYKAFADLITNDGYRVTPNREPFTPELLARYDLVIIANATAKAGPKPSALTEAECDSVAARVKAGGALLLITDHEPYASGSDELGKRFGVDMSLLVTVDPANQTKNGLLFSRERNQLGDHAILRGRDASERVNRVLTFVGQSLKGPPRSVALLKFADSAKDVGRGKELSAAGRAQGVAFKFGQGRVVVMGEAGDLSAQVHGDPPEKMGMNVPGCDNRQFALNMMHWLSGLID